MWRGEPHIPFVWNISGDSRDRSQWDCVDVRAHEQTPSVQVVGFKNSRLVYRCTINKMKVLVFKTVRVEGFTFLIHRFRSHLISTVSIFVEVQFFIQFSWGNSKFASVRMILILILYSKRVFTLNHLQLLVPPCLSSLCPRLLRFMVPLFTLWKAYMKVQPFINNNTSLSHLNS